MLESVILIIVDIVCKDKVFVRLAFCEAVLFVLHWLSGGAKFDLVVADIYPSPFNAAFFSVNRQAFFFGAPD